MSRSPASSETFAPTTTTTTDKPIISTSPKVLRPAISSPALAAALVLDPVSVDGDVAACWAGPRLSWRNSGLQRRLITVDVPLVADFDRFGRLEPAIAEVRSFAEDIRPGTVSTLRRRVGDDALDCIGQLDGLDESIVGVAEALRWAR